MASISVPHYLPRCIYVMTPSQREPAYGFDPLQHRPQFCRLRSQVTELHSAVKSCPPTGATKLSAWTSVNRERWEGELPVEGDIPLWLRGTYLRNGPGIWHAGDHQFGHLFDGFGMIVRLHFDDGRITAGHRQIESEAYKAAKKYGRLFYREFSESPKCDSQLAHILSFLGLLSGRFFTDNAGVNVVQLGDGRVLCLTETVTGSIQIDPDTLETLGRFKYSNKLRGLLLHSGHPSITKKELLTLMPDFVRNGYSVVRMEAGTNERKVIGRVGCRGGPTPGWLHSFPVTDNYVVVPEMMLRYSIPNLLQGVPSPFKWYPNSGNYMHVLSRSCGKFVASVRMPDFMALHYINAYEEVDKEGRVSAIIVDSCEHNANPTIILETLKIQNLVSFDGQDTLPDSRVGRFRIPLDGSLFGSLDSALNPEEHGRGLDMCSINPMYLGRPYRYVYACGAHRPCNFLNTLTKVDLVEKKAKNWHEEGAVPSEPFFIARPGATEEDDGVVISIVSCKNGEGYALILDGLSFEEIARGKLPYGLPYGFHGCWVPHK